MYLGLYVIIFIDLLINTIACIQIFHVIAIYTISCPVEMLYRS